MDLTVDTSTLAATAARVARFLPTRAMAPVLSGILLSTVDDLMLAGTDGERSIRTRCSAIVHTPGTVLVPGRAFVDTVRALDTPDLRLAVEGSQLAVRAGRARFALPLLDTDLHPGVSEPPTATGSAAIDHMLPAMTAVASAASREDALPLFSGIRLRANENRLRLVATDRYRMAVAELPWAGDEVDVLVPAALTADITRLVSGSERITVHADADRVALRWAGTTIASPVLASPFPDEDRYLNRPADGIVEVDADALAGAVRRAGLYADGRGAISIDPGDGELVVRGGGADNTGEAEEPVKATVDGRVRQTYRARYLAEALRWFAGQRVRLGMQNGLKSTAITAVDTPHSDRWLRYVVMPILPQDSR